MIPISELVGRVERGVWCFVTSISDSSPEAALVSALHELRQRANLRDRTATTEEPAGVLTTSFSVGWPGSFRVTVAAFNKDGETRVAYVYALHSKTDRAQEFINTRSFKDDSWLLDPEVAR